MKNTYKDLKPFVTIIKKLHKNNLKAILTLKAQFENIF
jgi:hypothetical protein